MNLRTFCLQSTFRTSHEFETPIPFSGIEAKSGSSQLETQSIQSIVLFLTMQRREWLKCCFVFSFHIEELPFKSGIKIK